jgi:hypothetical protein
VVLRLGSLQLGDTWTKVVKQFGRRELDASRVEELLADRMRASGHALDLARFGLDPLLDHAASSGLTLALANRARWFEVPDDAELGVLLEDFRGAPLGAWFDAAAGHAREALGFGRVADWLGAHGKRTAGAFLGDACGLRGGLPWGRGEMDTAAVEGALSEDAPRLVHCTADATDQELAAALGGAPTAGPASPSGSEPCC